MYKRLLCEEFTDMVTRKKITLDDKETEKRLISFQEYKGRTIMFTKFITIYYLIVLNKGLKHLRPIEKFPAFLFAYIMLPSTTVASFSFETTRRFENLALAYEDKILELKPHLKEFKTNTVQFKKMTDLKPASNAMNATNIPSQPDQSILREPEKTEDFEGFYKRYDPDYVQAEKSKKGIEENKFMENAEDFSNQENISNFIRSEYPDETISEREDERNSKIEANSSVSDAPGPYDWILASNKNKPRN